MDDDKNTVTKYQLTVCVSLFYFVRLHFFNILTSRKYGQTTIMEFCLEVYSKYTLVTVPISSIYNSLLLLIK